MPLQESSTDAVPTDCDFIVFYASIDPETDRMWCGDCRDVEHLVREAFRSESAPDARIVYVGQKPEWKSPDQPLRHDPWFLKSIPTIVKLQNGKEVARLVEGEVASGLASFIQP